MSSPSFRAGGAPVQIRPMREADAPEVRRIFRVAFGTFLGVPDPESFGADHDFVVSRWRGNPGGVLVAERDGAVAGSNFVTAWGSFGFFGPLTVRPDLWNQGTAQRLLAPTLDLFAQWGVRQAGLFTFANSPKHLALYEKYGFRARFLTAIMKRAVSAERPGAALHYSLLGDSGRQQALAACRSLCDPLYRGLDLTPEIRVVDTLGLGDTLLLWNGGALDCFAVCHCGEVSEAGRGACYVKFAAARNGPAFARLLDECESFAAERGLDWIEAGVNLERGPAYRAMQERGFRTEFLGVAMLRPEAQAWNRPDAFVIDDWR